MKQLFMIWYITLKAILPGKDLMVSKMEKKLSEKVKSCDMKLIKAKNLQNFCK